MKYIRTKEGIYEPTKWQCDLSGEMILVKANNKFGNDKVFMKDIIEQANTIEELCDEFVWVSVNGEYANRKANEYGLRTSKMQLGCPQLKTIYGAIWTDKGLIYVAKMNEKGELELL